MARFKETTAALRIWGDDLIPEEISRLIGRAPDRSHLKGDILSAKGRIAKHGLWQFGGPFREPGDLAADIIALLAALPDDPAMWRELGERFDMVVFCGVFMVQGNEGFRLPPMVLAACAERGLAVYLNIYGPSDEEGDVPDSSTHSG